MHVAAIGAATLLAGVLIASALAKSANPTPFLETIRSLGVPSRMAPLSAAVTIFAEWVVGVLLLTRTGSVWPLLLATVLFVFFAGIGTFALVSKRRIECNCLGTLAHRRELGWFQLAQLPVALALITVAWSAPSLTPSQSLTALLALHLGVALSGLARAGSSWSMVRVQRRSLRLLDQPTPGFSAREGR
jgi:hypothetical protein